MTLSPILRVAIAAAGAAYVAPKIANSLIGPEETTLDTIRNKAAIYGSVGAATAGIYLALGMVFGGAKASAAGGGGAS